MKSDENPFVAYRQAGVPVSLNTDDEGVLGSDLSHEFFRAAGDYHLDYGDLKELARNSIEYSFLPGHRLFRSREFKAWVSACPAGVDGEDLPGRYTATGSAPIAALISITIPKPRRRLAWSTNSSSSNRAPACDGFSRVGARMNTNSYFPD